MKVKDRKIKYQILIQEISLGNCKIRETGGCHVITIPKNISKEYQLKKGDKVDVILLKKKKMYFGSLKEGEEWVKLDKRERIMFEQWKKEKENEWK